MSDNAKLCRIIFLFGLCFFFQYLTITNKKYEINSIDIANFVDGCLIIKDFLNKCLTLYKKESEKYLAKYNNIKKQRNISNLINL